MIDCFLTLTGVTHKNNPNGTLTTPATVSSSVVITPIDPASKKTEQDYPIEKLSLLRECFTKYTAFVTGDFLVSGGVTYAVIGVHPWESQGGVDDFYHLILEQALDS